VSEESEIPHPRETLSLYGHAEAEQAFLDAYRGGRVPHAWLIGGVGIGGIGKATLAYRMARFAFAYPDQSAAAVSDASSLALLPDNPAVRRVAAQGHPDLLALEQNSSAAAADVVRYVMRLHLADHCRGMIKSTPGVERHHLRCRRPHHE